MTRSLYKGVYLNQEIREMVKQEVTNGIIVGSLYTMDRSCMIIPILVGKQIMVHNGIEFHLVKISPEMVGHKLGEFVGTRKRAIYKRKRRK